MKILHLDLLTIAAVVLAVIFTDAQAGTIHTDRLTFMSTINNAITDDYQNPLYEHGDIWDFPINERFSDARMTEISGHTTYRTTGVADHNATARYMMYNLDGTENFDRFYCGGCSGSFELSWTNSVTGVGLDIASNYSSHQYGATVLFDDSTWQHYDLPLEENAKISTLFWGLTSDLGIKSIHFGDPDFGLVAYEGSFAIDNLTIGVSAVPIPAAFWLFGTALLGVAGLSRRVMG
jgi:hypothetical protein